MERLVLKELGVDEIIHILAGEGDDTTEFFFKVLQSGRFPLCEFIQRPEGQDTYAGEIPVQLEGSLTVNDPDEYYEDDDTRVIEAGDGQIRIGGLLIIKDQREPTPSGDQKRCLVYPPISGLFVRGRE